MEEAMHKENLFNSILKGQGKTFIQSVIDAGLDVNERICGNTLLSFAAECGNLEIVEFLIQKGVDINIKNSNGSKPLHIAAYFGHKDIVELFVNLGVFVDSRDNDNCTPLHYVIGRSCKQVVQSPIKKETTSKSSGLKNITASMLSIRNIPKESHLDVANFLLCKGADLDAINNDGCTPLLLAANYSLKNLFEFLIKSGAKADCSNSDQWTVLHYACYNGWLEIVRILVDQGCDIGVKTASGNTPLRLAAKHSHKDVVEFLIESGANFFVDKDGWSVFHHASYNGWLAVVQVLINRKCDPNAKSSKYEPPVYLAACNSHEDVVRLLIESGANVKWCGRNKWTVLHEASQKGWLGIVKSLVKRGSDTNAETVNGETPLLLAAVYSHFDVVEFLIEFKANIECRDQDYWTVLHYASQRGCLQIVKSLLNRGCDLNVKTSRGYTALFLAADNLHRDVVALLLESGADDECYGHNKWTLLHHASHNKWVDLVETLVNKGFNVNAKSSIGDTPLHIACKVKKKKIMMYLLKAGADCNVKNRIGDTAFSCIVKTWSDIEIIRLFVDNGAYFDSNSYKINIINKIILQDIKLCTQAIINKFNNKDLPTIYTSPRSVESLPLIEKLKNANNRSVVQDIQQSVEHDIRTKGFCNVLEACPIVLNILSVKSFIEGYQCNLIS